MMDDEETEVLSPQDFMLKVAGLELGEYFVFSIEDVNFHVMRIQRGER